MASELSKPVQIVAVGDNYNAQGLLLIDKKVKLLKGSYLNPITAPNLLPAATLLRTMILEHKCDSYCLKEDLVLEDYSQATAVVTGSLRFTGTAFKTIDGIDIEHILAGGEGREKLTMQEQRILFCNVAYMKFYNNYIDDRPINGGRYVLENKDAFEKFNFQKSTDGFFYGFVETKYHKGYREGLKNHQYNYLHIEKINPAFKNNDFIDNVLVVFCAKPAKGPTVVVGWYDHATVYRKRLYQGDRFYNLKAKVTDSILLKDDERTFEVPRAKNSPDGEGFGQSNLWYANRDKDKIFVNKVLDYIKGKTTFSSNPSENNDVVYGFFEDGTGKRHSSVQYERNPEARRKCLQIHGTKCAICGFDAAVIYGQEFAGKIEVHHIVPISTKGKEYILNPSTDLIPVCPNCHTILHTKIDGHERTIEALKNRFNK